MRTLSKLLIAGAGALAVGGVAIAASSPNHVMNVALPDGSVAQIHYVGDVAPKVVVAPDEAMPVAFVAADPFAMMDRISLAMDRQMDAMLQQASLMANAAPAANGQLSEAALKTLPAGTVSYSFTSYSSGNGASCSQSVQVTSLGANQAPKVERQSQGDCTAMNSRQATPAVQQAKPGAPTLTPASLEKPKAPAAKGPII
ncbi:MAG TPA: hypothetical protein VK533_06835 [Sphingomonas sp.]|nr:hypothetical protein [Sphingomonas sp.]